MHLNKSFLSFCCMVTLCCCLAQSAAQNVQNTRKKDITETSQSNIYKIKRLDKELVPKRIKSIKNRTKHIETLPSNEHQTTIPESTVAMTLPETVKKTRTKKLKSSHAMNKKLLSKLGFTKVKAPNSHNRKRLAIESRRHVSPDDSHMFIIKLPPSANYYSSPKANEGANGGFNSKNTIHGYNKENEKKTFVGSVLSSSASSASSSSSSLPSSSLSDAIDNGKKVSFPFSSNGRPGRIYHWNLPVIQKILEDKQRFAHVPNAMKQQLMDIKDTPTWNKPWENETIEKSYGKAGNMMHHYKKSMKRKTPTYYAPATNVNKNSFHKYFAGNGKPKGFYVIKENQKKPLYYKNIVS